jgi:hypothetical protein
MSTVGRNIRLQKFRIRKTRLFQQTRLYKANEIIRAVFDRHNRLKVSQIDGNSI